MANNRKVNILISDLGLWSYVESFAVYFFVGFSIGIISITAKYLPFSVSNSVFIDFYKESIALYTFVTICGFGMFLGFLSRVIHYKLLDYIYKPILRTGISTGVIMSGITLGVSIILPNSHVIFAGIYTLYITLLCICIFSGLLKYDGMVAKVISIIISSIALVVFYISDKNLFVWVIVLVVLVILNANSDKAKKNVIGLKVH